jgi:hypothetical protein
VAEHFFDVVEVGACADHFGGAASAEGVEGDAGLEVCVFGVKEFEEGPISISF